MIEVIVLTSLVLIFSIIQLYLVSIYFQSFFELRVTSIVFYVSTLILLGMTKMMSEETDSIIKMLVFVFFLSIAIMVSFQGPIIKKAYHIIFFSLMMLLADMGLSIIVTHYFMDHIVQSRFAFVLFLVPNLLSLLVSMILIKILLYFKADLNVDIDVREYLLLSIIPICSIIGIYWIQQYKEIELYIPCFFLLIVNVCIMIFYYEIIAKNLSSQNYLLMKNQNEYYEENLINQEEIRRLKHDLKNILVNLDYHLSNKQIDEAREYLAKIIESDVFTYKILSGCIPIDSVLNCKIEIMRRNNISYKLNLQIPNDVEIKNVIDMTAIIGNLLDNAIEEVIRVNKSTANILIMLRYHQNKLIIDIKNSCRDKKVHVDSDTILSSKGFNRYGIGIRSVKNRVDKLGGYYDFSSKNNCFTALVVLAI